MLRNRRTFSAVLVRLTLLIVCIFAGYQQQQLQRPQFVSASTSADTISSSSLSSQQTPTPSVTIDPPPETDTSTERDTFEIMSKKSNDAVGDLRIVFSDLDGTLIHYPPETMPSSSSDDHDTTKPVPKNQRGNNLLKLPPSSTGMRGVISSKTLQYIQSIRNRGIKFVLVSGMRTSTFLSRLPYLPRADAYCTEAGGRMFYPIITNDGGDNVNGKANVNSNNKDQLQELESSGRDVFIVKPKHYDGATKDELKPFAIEEDLEWRENMERLAGPFASPPLKELAKDPSKVKDLRERDGLLWDFARNLVHDGFAVDTKGYSACFRVNKKQQKLPDVTDDDFNSLIDGRTQPFEGLASSVNLACVDYYPSTSGKRNCCLYLSSKFFSKSDGNSAGFVSKSAVCLCDDDNDLEMALSCRCAFIPAVTSESMKEAIARYPDQFIVTSDDELSPTESTETALSMILEGLEGIDTKEEEDTQVEASTEA